ncbi:MAG: AGE family epimerase/isomerase [Candidatus Humimicrobiaceae bacterium]
MKEQRLLELKELYKKILLDDIVPFWLRYSLDKKNGGYYHYLDRDGSILSKDKSVWVQGRECWLFAKLYNSLEKRKEWLEASTLGYEFLKNYCFDTDGRMFFQVTFDGRPLRKRRYWFSETFAIIAFSEYAKTTGSDEAFEKAKELYKMIVDFYNNPSKLPPKIYPETRLIKSHASSMILLATSQIIREIDSDPIYNDIIDMCMNDIFKFFIKKDKKALLEIVGKEGEIIDTPDGRCINPGHAIETSWFLMQEGLYRKEQYIIDIALDILNWSLERGWDKEYGGIFNFVDIKNKPSEKVEWDMKYWWPHCEALYALLLANYITGNKLYENWYEKIHEWTFKYFPDKEYGEWYGYLHRDGSVCLPIKGSVWKGPFHLPRYLLYGIKLLEKMQGKEGKQNK